MTVYSLNIEPSLITHLRNNDFDVVSISSLPDPNHIKESDVIMLSGKDILLDELGDLKERYKGDIILAGSEKGIAGWQSTAAICNSLSIKFIRPNISNELLIDQLNAWYKGTEKESKLIGIFGSHAGVGTTSIAGTISQALTELSGKKVCMLGLNLYNSGWEEGSAVSLDAWRQRLIAKVLQQEDLSQLMKVKDFNYLKGNRDLLSVLDYEENEIEYLISIVEKEADFVVGDFGAIPESAAWTTGLQNAAIRIMVAHPAHNERLSSLLRVSADLGVPAENWFVITNRSQSDDVSLRTIAQAHGMQPLFSVPYKGQVNDFMLPHSDRELEAIKKSLLPISQVFSYEELKQKGRRS